MMIQSLPISSAFRHQLDTVVFTQSEDGNQRGACAIIGDILKGSWFSQPDGCDFNGHLIRDPGGNNCVDFAEPTEDDIDAVILGGNLDAKLLRLEEFAAGRSAPKERPPI